MAGPPTTADSGKQPALSRQLGPSDAVIIGLGSMTGAGVFSAFAPAAAAAGSWLTIGLAIAALAAYCNATSSAQLAAQYPTSGGTYIYGRERLGQWAGFLAGWGYVVGKIASCAAMALTFATYAVPDGWQKPVGILAVILLTAVNYRGVTRTAKLTRIIVTLTLATLVVVVAAAWLSSGASLHRADPVGTEFSVYGVLQSAGLLFFAFAGYARIATMGEEVKNPRRTIPRAILIALGLTVGIYAIVGISAFATLGPETLAASSAPLADTVAAGSWTWAVPIVRIGAAIAALGALLSLITGIGRTTLAMARNDDLPSWLAAVHPTYKVPHHADIAAAAVICVLVLVVDLRGAIGFSSFGVLIYYLIANMSAWTQTGEFRLYPKAFQALGAALCVVLVATLPWTSIVGGVAVFAVGIVYRLLWVRRRSAGSR